IDRLEPSACTTVKMAPDRCVLVLYLADQAFRIRPVESAFVHHRASPTLPRLRVYNDQDGELHDLALPSIANVVVAGKRQTLKRVEDTQVVRGVVRLRDKLAINHQLSPDRPWKALREVAVEAPTVLPVFIKNAMKIGIARVYAAI